MLCGSQEGGLRVFRLKLTEYEASSQPRAIISMEEFAATHPVYLYTVHGCRTDSRGLGQLKKLAWPGRKENAFRSGGY